MIVSLNLNQESSSHLVLSEPADILHLRHRHWVGDLVVYVGDEHLAVVGGLHPDLGDVAVIESLVRVRGVRPAHA